MIDRGSLEKFAEKKNKDKVQDFYQKALSIITSALDDILKEKGSIFNFDIDSTRIFPNGDYTNDTFIDESGELEIIIASSNSQLILSNDIYQKAFQEAKNSKKKLSKLAPETSFSGIITTLLNKLTEYFDNRTLLLLTNEGIKILCVEEYGFKILIRFATFDEKDDQGILNFWNPIINKINPTNLFLYNDNMELKDVLTNGNYKKLVRIFKNVRKTILLNKWATNSDINKYFIEIITYNIPNAILQDDDIELMFYKAVNYLTSCDIYNFVSFDNGPIDNFTFAKVSYSNIKNFINYLNTI